MNDDGVANEAHAGAALDIAVGDAAAGDVADFRHLEYFENLSVAEHGFADGRRQQAGHGLFHVVDQIVDDVVVADFDAVALRRFARFLVGAHVEGDDRHAGGFGQRDVAFRNAADAVVQHAGRDFVGAELVERAVDRFQRSLHVGLDDQREFLAARGLGLRHHLLERAAHAGGPGRGLLALLTRTVIGDFAGARFVLDDGETVAGIRRAGEAEHFDRSRGTGSADGLTCVGDERADAAPFGAGDDKVADLQGAALDQHGGDRATAAVEFGFDHSAFGRTLRVRLEVEDFGLQTQHFQQFVDVELLGRRDFDVDHIAAERLDLDLVLQQFSAYAVRLGVRLVDLVDGDDDRNLGRFRVMNRFHRLRHDAVIGGDHKHDNVGHLGAARAHRREGGVAGRIDEGNLAAQRRGHLIGANVLGDAAGLARHDVGGADGVEQRRLAVIDVAHDGHHRCARHHVGRIVGGVEQTFFDVGLGDAANRVAHFLGDDLRGVGVDHVVDRHHLTLLHHQANNVDRAFRHAVGEIGDGDGFRDRHLAHELFLRLVG